MSSLEPDPAVPALPMRVEFTGNSGVRYELVLTEKEFTVQKVGPGIRKSERFTAIVLQDCIGCRAYESEDGADTAAGLEVYHYPVKRHWVGLCSALGRCRVEHRLRMAVSPDPRINLEEARRWSKAIRDGSVHRPGGVCVEVRRPRRFLVLINPRSGKGRAEALFHNHVQHMLQDADITYTLKITEYQNHARELVRVMDLSQWDAVVIMSGDGLLFEVVNGLMERGNWEEAIQIPLGVLPGGSGNALAASIHYYSGSQPMFRKELLVSCGFMLCKSLVSHMDLISVSMASGQRLFSFLSIAWGFVADVDIESEKYRQIGAARFTMGTVVRLLSLRVYKGQLSYLPAEECESVPSPTRSTVTFNDGSKSSLLNSHLSRNSDQFLHKSFNLNNSHKPNWTTESPGTTQGPHDSLLVPLDQPVPPHWTIVKEEDFVLVLAVYQSHLAEGLIAAPASRLEDGIIHLMYVKAGISRTDLLRLFLAMEKGAHLSINCPYVVYEKVHALRLEPYSPNGTITVDGEVVEYGPVQAQVHGSLARVIAR